MAKHSSIVGGSTASRLLNCPGSYQATVKLPPSADISSEYAEEGTAMHAVMTWLMEARRLREATPDKPPRDMHAFARDLIGQPFHDRDLTQEHLDTMILPALDALAELEKAYGGGFEVAGVELHVAFPGVPGAFGTCDLILRSYTVGTLLHVDWKFGQGVGVRAVYRDANNDETVNAQLLYYCAGAMNSHKPLYRGVSKLALAIIQPRAAEPLTHTTVSRREVKMFVEDIKAAVVEALDYDPARRKGEWCRFAPCKINCPLWTGPLLELAALMPVPPTPPSEVSKSGLSVLTPYGEYLVRAKTLVDLLAMFKKEVDEQLHAYLTDGGFVPGWRLKAKAKQRQWIDDTTVEHTLEDIGFDTKDIWQRKLVTFAAADATAKRLGVKIPDHLRVAPPSNETTVAPTDDPAPVVNRARAVEAVREALALLK